MNSVLGPDSASAEFFMLGTDDFVTLSHTLALAAGIDVEEYGKRINAERPSAYGFGLAIRVLAESQGVYKEVPNAYSIHRVPRAFLVLVRALAVGIATSRFEHGNELAAGAAAGAGALIINILSARATSGKSELKWFEEMVLSLVEQEKTTDLNRLAMLTGLHKELIKLAAEGLTKKGYIVSERAAPRSRNFRYRIK